MLRRAPLRARKRLRAKPRKSTRAEKGVIRHRDGREVCLLTTAKGRAEYKRRILVMALRQGWQCSLCPKLMWAGDPPTFEHEAGRGFDGGHRDDRIEINGRPYNSAAHGLCNSLKGSRRGA